MPAVFGVIRLVLMAVFLLRFETPQYFIDNFKGSKQMLAEKLNGVHKLIYEDTCAQRLTSELIDQKEKREA